MSVPFRFKDILLRDDDPKLSYSERSKKEGFYWGQRKLLIDELLFLTLAYKENDTLIYAGASPGHHISLFPILFPGIKLILYDPRESFLKDTENIKIYKSYFTYQDALKWSNTLDMKKVLFMSDIRSVDTESAPTEEGEKEVIENMRNQESWYLILNPRSELLKFRLPYPNPKNPNIPNSLVYLNGQIWKQPWNRLSSTECRLLPINGRKFWNAKDYEDQLFYFNSVVRPKERFQSLELEKNIGPFFESAMETWVLNLYINKYPDILCEFDNMDPESYVCDEDKHTMIIDLSKYITNILTKETGIRKTDIASHYSIDQKGKRRVWGLQRGDIPFH